MRSLRLSPTWLLPCSLSRTQWKWRCGVRHCSRSCGRARIAAVRMGENPGEPTSPPLSAAVMGGPESLERKKAAICDHGPAKLQVIADFDGTLTRYWIDGCRGQTSHGLLQQSNPEYDAKRQALYEYYHPLEYSPTIALDEKTKLMEEWWEKTHSLLIEGGLTYNDIHKSVSSANIAFRDGVVELFEFLEEKGVPVLIFSAGLADIIEEVFRQKLHRSFRNIKIVSNRMIFDNGRLVAFQGISRLCDSSFCVQQSMPSGEVLRQLEIINTVYDDILTIYNSFIFSGKTIHVLNKNEHALDMAAPVHDQLEDSNGSNDDNMSIRKRTNVLLLGDHIGDLGMSDGLKYENRIAIGFLNDNIEKSLETYREAFDVVFLNDASMHGVLDLVSQLCRCNT